MAFTLERTLTASSDTQSVDFSPNGKYLAYGGNDDEITIYDVSDPTPANWSLVKTFTKASAGRFWDIRWSNDGNLLAGASLDGDTYVYDVSDATPANWAIDQTLAVSATDWSRSVIWSPDDAYLAIGSNDGNLKIYETTTWTVEKTFTDAAGYIYGEWKGDMLAIAAGGTGTLVYDTSDAAPANWVLDQTLLETGEEHIDCAFNPGETELAIANNVSGVELRVYETTTWTLVTSQSQADRALCVEYANTLPELALGDQINTTAYIYDTGDYTASPTTLTDPTGRVYDVSYKYNDTLFAASTLGGNVYVYSNSAASANPTVTTDAADAIGETTATLNGELIDLGGEASVDVFFEYRETGAGTWTETTKQTVSAIGVYDQALTGLTAATEYEFRAKVEWNSGANSATGSTLTFTTNAALTAPTVTTQAVSSIADTSATGNGNVTDDGGATITERGVVYSTATAPTTADNKATSAGTTGAFTASMTSLTPETTYYVRAYAINSEGTSYGSEVSFTTTATPTTATVTTGAVTSINTTNATGNGEVTDDGNATVTERGVVYSTTSTPTTADNKAQAAAGGTGVFTANITGLTADTLYYVRAYAINSEGTSYGSEVTFTTLATPQTGATYHPLKVWNGTDWERLT